LHLISLKASLKKTEKWLWVRIWVWFSYAKNNMLIDSHGVGSISGGRCYHGYKVNS
jgi:hypothetical protein